MNETNNGESVDIQLLAMEVRQKYSEGLKDLFSKYTKKKIKRIQMNNVHQLPRCEDVQMTLLDTSITDKTYTTTLNDKTVTKLKNAVKEQISVLKMYNQNRTCPTARIMDEL